MLYSFTYVTLDGVIADPHLWHPRFDSAESTELLTSMLEASAAMLLGRRTYDEFASWWPTQGTTTPLAAVVNGIDKHVVTSTRLEPVWQGASVLEPPVDAAVAALHNAAEPVMVAGSATLTTSLLRWGVLDEVRLFSDPYVRGRGLRLFGGADPTAMERLEDRAFPSGTRYVVLRPLGAVDDVAP